MLCTGDDDDDEDDDDDDNDDDDVALHRCDPPSVPYLGIYLSDLTFIDEGTPNRTEKNLINFAKMRMIAHVIREVRLIIIITIIIIIIIIR